MWFYISQQCFRVGGARVAACDTKAREWNNVKIEDGSTGYRLPTEAQWEYAAKGGANPPVGYTYAGSNEPGVVAWYSANSGGQTHEVGLLQPNGLGLYDMSGNVYEWCWDWYGSYTSIAKEDPTGASSGSNRVSRGGFYGLLSATATRSVNRGDIRPDFRDYYVGFRLARP